MRDWIENKDGTITKAEFDFAERIFELWDSDNSNSLELKEFETWYREYLG